MERRKESLLRLRCQKSCFTFFSCWILSPMLWFGWGGRNKSGKIKTRSHKGKQQPRQRMQTAPPPRWNDLWCLGSCHTPSKATLPSPCPTPVTARCYFPFPTGYPVQPGSEHWACSSDSWPGLVRSAPRRHCGELLSEQLMNDKWQGSSYSPSSGHEVLSTNGQISKTFWGLEGTQEDTNCDFLPGRWGQWGSLRLADFPKAIPCKGRTQTRTQVP